MSRMFSLVPPAVVLTLAVVTPVFTEAPTEPLLYKLNSAARQVTVFENVNVIPMDANRLLSNQTVVIRHGRIFEIGPADGNRKAIPDTAQRIDGRVKYLMPGLASTTSNRSSIKRQRPSGDGSRGRERCGSW